MSKFAMVGGVSLLGCIYGYKYVTDETMKSSSLVQQSLFNLSNQEWSGRAPVKIVSSIRGHMNQYKGNADINFDVKDANESNSKSFTRQYTDRYRCSSRICQGPSPRAELGDRQLQCATIIVHKRAKINGFIYSASQILDMYF